MWFFCQGETNNFIKPLTNKHEIIDYKSTITVFYLFRKDAYEDAQQANNKFSIPKPYELFLFVYGGFTAKKSSSFSRFSPS